MFYFIVLLCVEALEAKRETRISAELSGFSCLVINSTIVCPISESTRRMKVSPCDIKGAVVYEGMLLHLVDK